MTMAFVNNSKNDWDKEKLIQEAQINGLFGFDKKLKELDKNATYNQFNLPTNNEVSQKSFLDSLVINNEEFKIILNLNIILSVITISQFLYLLFSCFIQ